MRAGHNCRREVSDSLQSSVCQKLVCRSFEIPGIASNRLFRNGRRDFLNACSDLSSNETLEMTIDPDATQSEIPNFTGSFLR